MCRAVLYLTWPIVLQALLGDLYIPLQRRLSQFSVNKRKCLYDYNSLIRGVVRPEY